MRPLITNKEEFVAAWNVAESIAQIAAQFGLTNQQSIVQACKFRGQGFILKNFRDGHEFLKCKHCGTVFQSYKSDSRQYCKKTCSDQHASDRAKTHGESRTRLHAIWCHMKTRCLCPTSPVHKYYGGRGITVCQEWQDSFEAFRDWAMANGYQDDLEIDRKETNGNYEPGNCRWATRVQQMQNTRKYSNAKTSKFKGVSRTTLNGKLTKWRVQLHANGSPVHVGVFDDEIEAAKAYDAAAREKYGEFASFNFPELQGSNQCRSKAI